MTAGPSPVPSLRAWAFAAYDRPGVQEACLELQDRHGMDVVALLWCIWAGEHHGAIDAEALGRIVAETRAWQAEVVAPLRAVRRRLKQADAVDAPGAAGDDAHLAARNRLRRQVADVELAAETIQLDRLDAATAGEIAASSIVGPPGAVAVRNNLTCLVAIAGSHDDPERDEVIAALAVCAVGGAA